MEITPKPIAIEHLNVPTEHQGLHNFLYSSEDEHAAKSEPIAIVNGRINDTIHNIDNPSVMTLAQWFQQIGDSKITGVYGVLDLNQELQYVNISRNVSLSLKVHQTQLGTDRCAFVRVSPFRSPKRDEMMTLQAAWIAENGAIPIGNQTAENLWTETTGEAAIAAMSPLERAAYEEKKLKLRKAMADSTLNREQPVMTTDTHNLGTNQPLATADTSDWSSIIDAQTQETQEKTQNTKSHG